MADAPIRRSIRIRNSEESRSIRKSPKKLLECRNIEEFMDSLMQSEHRELPLSKNNAWVPGDRKSRSILNNRKKITNEFPILKLIPSKSATIEIDDSLPCSTKFDVLTKMVLKIKLDLERINKQDKCSEFLIKSADETIDIVERYLYYSKPHPFCWFRLKFPTSLPYTKFKDYVGDRFSTSFSNSSRLSDDDSACIAPYRERSIWNGFKKAFAKETPEHKKSESIKLDHNHPIVRLIGNFAVAAFNEACETHVKKGEHNNIHDFEFIECRYKNNSDGGFLFFMTIEAFEEGNVGVYQTQVLCDSHGTRSLIQFILTDIIPTGAKAMAISLFFCVRSLCETLKCDKKKKESELQKILNVTLGPENGTAWLLMDILDDASNATVKGLVNVVTLGIRLLLSPNCNRTTNPDVWSHPGSSSGSWMVPRGMGAPCRGYDYLNDSRPLQTLADGACKGEGERPTLETKCKTIFDFFFLKLIQKLYRPSIKLQT